MTRKQWALAFLGGLMLFSCGRATAETQTRTVIQEMSVPGPTVVRTVEVERSPATVEVVRNVPGPTVYRTPQSCFDFIDAAQKALEISGAAMGAAGEVMEAASRLSAAGIRTAGAKMAVERSRIEVLTPRYQSTRDACAASR